MVVDLKRLSPHLTGKPCAVKVARTVWSGGKTREGSTYHYQMTQNSRNPRESAIQMMNTTHSVFLMNAEVIKTSDNL